MTTTQTRSRSYKMTMPEHGITRSYGTERKAIAGAARLIAHWYDGATRSAPVAFIATPAGERLTVRDSGCMGVTVSR